MEKISIILPVYNSESTLERCLVSLKNQTYFNLEILIIDDGSRDGSIKIAKEYEKNDKRFKVYTQNNAGVSTSRNKGVKLAAGKYIMFIDADDYVNVNWCKEMVEALEASQADMAVCNYLINKNDFPEKNERHADKGLKTIRQYIKLMSRYPDSYYFGVVWNKIYRKEMIDSYKLQFETGCSLGEDFIFNLQYLLYASSIHMVYTPLYHYSIAFSESLSRRNKGIQVKIEERARLYQEYKKFCRQIGIYATLQYKIHSYAYKYSERLKNDIISSYVNPDKKNLEKYVDSQFNLKYPISLEQSIYKFDREMRRIIKLGLFSLKRGEGVRNAVKASWYALMKKVHFHKKVLLICEDSQKRKILSEILQNCASNLKITYLQHEQDIQHRCNWDVVITAKQLATSTIALLYDARIVTIDEQYDFNHVVKRSNSIKILYMKRDFAIISDKRKADKVNCELHNREERAYYMKDIWNEEGEKEMRQLLNYLLK